MIDSAVIAKVKVAFVIFSGDKAVNMLLYEALLKTAALTLSEVLIIPLMFNVFKLEHPEKIFVQLILEPHDDRSIPLTDKSDEHPMNIPTKLVPFEVSKFPTAPNDSQFENVEVKLV